MRVRVSERNGDREWQRKDEGEKLTVKQAETCGGRKGGKGKGEAGREEQVSSELRKQIMPVSQ